MLYPQQPRMLNYRCQAVCLAASPVTIPIVAALDNYASVKTGSARVATGYSHKDFRFFFYDATGYAITPDMGWFL